MNPPAWFTNSASKFGTALLLSTLLSLTAPLAAQKKGIAEFPKLSATTDWPWWRGPLRNGLTTLKQVPTKFTEAQAAWKAEVPGRGHASPIVVGNRVFLATADEEAKTQSILAYDRTSGKQLWQTEVNRGGFPAAIHGKNTHASSTVACDGELVFGVFYHHDQLEIVALDLNGQVKWRKSAGKFIPKRYEYGYGSSPLIYRDSVIVAAEWDGDSFIVAFERFSGQEKWRIPRAKNITFSSPVVGFVAGRDQLLISGSDHVDSFDPNTGKPLWSQSGTSAATCGTLVWDGDIVFASGGYPKAETIAIKADGSGEVLWTNNVKCYEQSLIVVGGYVYGLSDNGVMYCWRGIDGKQMWTERLIGPVSASPVLAGGNIYWASERGFLFVFRPNPEKYEEVARNRLGNESFASPAVCGNELFLRVGQRTEEGRKEYLYCFRGQ